MYEEEENEDYGVERFVFPDGTERDMLVFDRAHEDAAEAGPQAFEARDVQVCPLCSSRLVHPIEWQRIGPAVWRISLRCPNCETVRTVHLSREDVERYNRVLYEGTEKLSRQAEQIARRNFTEESDKFVAALEADLILPMDF
jgi:hypothetical protein